MSLHIILFICAALSSVTSEFTAVENFYFIPKVIFTGNKDRTSCSLRNWEFSTRSTLVNFKKGYIFHARGSAKATVERQSLFEKDGPALLFPDFTII